MQSFPLRAAFEDGKLLNLGIQPTLRSEADICRKKTNLVFHDIRFQKDLLHALSSLLNKRNILF